MSIELNMIREDGKLTFKASNNGSGSTRSFTDSECLALKELVSGVHTDGTPVKDGRWPILGPAAVALAR